MIPTVWRPLTPNDKLVVYGVDDPAFERDGAPRMVRNFCVARRLVEAGARVVSMNFIRQPMTNRRILSPTPITFGLSGLTRTITLKRSSN